LLLQHGRPGSSSEELRQDTALVVAADLSCERRHPAVQPPLCAALLRPPAQRPPKSTCGNRNDGYTTWPRCLQATWPRAGLSQHCGALVLGTTSSRTRRNGDANNGAL